MAAFGAAVLTALIGIMPFAAGVLSFRNRQLDLVEREARLLSELPDGRASDTVRAILEVHLEEYARHQRGEPRPLTGEQALLVISGFLVAGLVTVQLATSLAGPLAPWRVGVQLIGYGTLLIGFVGFGILGFRALRNAVRHGRTAVHRRWSVRSASRTHTSKAGGGSAVARTEPSTSPLDRDSLVA